MQDSMREAPKPVLRAVLSRMQSDGPHPSCDRVHATRRTPHGASRLLPAMSAWSTKARRAPSRHCRDARVYGHTTTAMHDMSVPPLHPGRLVCSWSWWRPVSLLRVSFLVVFPAALPWDRCSCSLLRGLRGTCSAGTEEPASSPR